MKSYLARLAERATLAAPPATPAAEAGAVADPFETVAPLEQAAPSAPPRAQETRSAPLPPPVAPPPVQTAAPPPAPGEPPPAPKLETVVRERIVETTVRPPAPPAVETSPAPAQARAPEEPVVLPPPVAPPIERVVTQSTVEEKRIVEERGREDQQLQQQLLRKADAFMGQLLDRRPPAPTPEPPAERAPAVLEPRIERESAPRLQPGQPRPPIHESAPEPPSLVIGRLTVEILPSAPAAAPSRPPIVIVRGARGAGRPSFPSSRRFGIGQF
jgi:hypothetical protein